MDNNIDTIRQRVEAQIGEKKQERGFQAKKQEIIDNARMLKGAGKQALGNKLEFIKDDFRKGVIDRQKNKLDLRKGENERKASKVQESLAKEKTKVEQSINTYKDFPELENALKQALVKKETETKLEVKNISAKNGEIDKEMISKNEKLAGIQNKENGLRKKVGEIFQPKLEKIDGKLEKISSFKNDLEALTADYQGKITKFEEKLAAYEDAVKNHPNIKSQVRDSMRNIKEQLRTARKEESRYQKQLDRANSQIEKTVKSRVKWSAAMAIMGGERAKQGEKVPNTYEKNPKEKEGQPGNVIDVEPHIINREQQKQEQSQVVQESPAASEQEKPYESSFNYQEYSKRRIVEAKDFENLYKAIHLMRFTQSNGEEFNGRDMEAKIRLVRSGLKPIYSITRDQGLRNKVAELLKQDEEEAA